MKNYKNNSPSITAEMAAEIRVLLKSGMSQHDIAAIFGINQGRVSEINTGKLFAERNDKDGH